jgi:hypothetical protein
MIYEKCKQATFAIHVNSRHEKVCSDCYNLNRDYLERTAYQGTILTNMVSVDDKVWFGVSR